MYKTVTVPWDADDDCQEHDYEDVLAEPPPVHPLGGVDGHPEADGEHHRAVPGKYIREISLLCEGSFAFQKERKRVNSESLMQRIEPLACF